MLMMLRLVVHRGELTRIRSLLRRVHHSPWSVSGSFRALQPQILGDQKGVALPFMFAKVADRLAFAVFDGAYFAVDVVLLGEAVEQVDGGGQVGVLFHRLADAQLPVFAVIAAAIVNQLGAVGFVGLNVGLQRGLQSWQVLFELFFLLFIQPVAGDENVYKHGGYLVELRGHFTTASAVLNAPSPGAALALGRYTA